MSVGSFPERLSDDDLDCREDRRLREMGIDPNASPGQILEAVRRKAAEMRAKYERDDDDPKVVEKPPE